MTIYESYQLMAAETGKPCYSVTFWRTVDGRWGARAGLGINQFGATIEDAIEEAIKNAIVMQSIMH